MAGMADDFCPECGRGRWAKAVGAPAEAWAIGRWVTRGTGPMGWTPTMRYWHRVVGVEAGDSLTACGLTVRPNTTTGRHWLDRRGEGMGLSRCPRCGPTV
jgi:hypothetical protein